MILNERDSRHEQVLQIGKQMMVAARTAPKAKGVDIIEAALITDEDIQRLSEEMRAVCEENGFKFFLRDADNIMEAECVLLIGTQELTHGLNCGHCGYATCAERPVGVPCALNSVDVGIAIGSACAIAADHRVHSCDVLCWSCSSTPRYIKRMQTSVCHTGQCLVKESIL